MRLSLEPADGDVIRRAFIYVLFTDVISAQEKRAIMIRLALLKQLLGCGSESCPDCRLNESCERAVTDIMGAS